MGGHVCYCHQDVNVEEVREKAVLDDPGSWEKFEWYQCCIFGEQRLTLTPAVNRYRLIVPPWWRLENCRMISRMGRKIFITRRRCDWKIHTYAIVESQHGPVQQDEYYRMSKLGPGILGNHCCYWSFAKQTFLNRIQRLS